MDRKILILSITLVVIILFLSFRKEGFSTAELESARTSEEEDIGEVEVPPGLNISDFLQKLEIMKDEKKKNEETLDALYGINRDDNQDSPEQASEAIQGENETQYAFLKDFVDGAQQTEQEIRDDARTQVNTQLEDIVTKQAEDYFSTKDTGFDDVPKKKGIVKIDNSSFDSLSAGLAAATDITTYAGTNVYGEGSQFYTAIVPRCHKRPRLAYGGTLYDGGTSSTSASRAYGQRVYDLSQSKWSCLNSDGLPDDVGEDGFVVDSFEQCASKCLANDKCSGFSVVPDSTFPDEGFGLTCKLTHHEFEDSKEVPASKNEQVFAIHENDYLKNPLYIDLFTARWGANGPYAARKGSDNHAIRGDSCHWRSACDYHQPWGCGLSKVFPDFAPDFYSYACQNGVKIENDTSKLNKIFMPTVNCGADGPNQPGNVSTSQITLGDCDYGNQSCPDYPGYQGGRIEGTKKVIGYDSQGKPAKNGGKSCDALMRERINANDPYWGLYKIVGNDIVAECGRACFNVPDAGPPPCDPRFQLCDGAFNPVADVGPPPAAKCDPLPVTHIDPDDPVWGWTYALAVDVRESLCPGLNEAECWSNASKYTPNGPKCIWSGGPPPYD